MKKTINQSLIGAHVSTQGGYINALNRANDIGANCLQMFSSNPRSYSIRTLSDEDIEKFNKYRAELNFPVYFHAVYLINLAEAGKIGKLSEINLINELNLASKIGVVGSIIHIGSFKKNEKNYELLYKNIEKILAKIPDNVSFIIENMGTNKIGSTLDEIGEIVKSMKDKRIRVCLDTCHMWAAGYDISTSDKYKKFFDEFDKKIGLDNLEVFQVNDSRDELGSFRDRHDNIGSGNIPMEYFRLLLNEEVTKNFPMILEVPGFDGSGPDKKNIDILKKLVK